MKSFQGCSFEGRVATLGLGFLFRADRLIEDVVFLLDQQPPSFLHQRKSSQFVPFKVTTLSLTRRARLAADRPS